MTAKEKARSDCGAPGLHKNTDAANSTDADKVFNTLRAVAAMRGHELRRSDRDDGTSVYFVTRWGLVKHFDSLAQVRAFMGKIGGQP